MAHNCGVLGSHKYAYVSTVTTVGATEPSVLGQKTDPTGIQKGPLGTVHKTISPS